MPQFSVVLVLFGSCIQGYTREFISVTSQTPRLIPREYGLGTYGYPYLSLDHATPVWCCHTCHFSPPSLPPPRVTANLHPENPQSRPSGLVRYRRRVPCLRCEIRPVSTNILRCWAIARGVMSNCEAICPKDSSTYLTRSNISRLLGSTIVWKASSNTAVY